MEEPYIIIFDGVCNLCNGAVNFILKRDPHKKFMFVALQSDLGRGLAAEHGVDTSTFDTLLLIKNKTCHIRSDAVMEITKDLSGFWCVLNIARFIPCKFRDYFYRILARNRYHLFGKRTSCMIPSPALKERFLVDP